MSCRSPRTIFDGYLMLPCPTIRRTLLRSFSDPPSECHLFSLIPNDVFSEPCRMKKFLESTFCWLRSAQNTWQSCIKQKSPILLLENRAKIICRIIYFIMESVAVLRSASSSSVFTMSPSGFKIL